MEKTGEDTRSYLSIGNSNEPTGKGGVLLRIRQVLIILLLLSITTILNFLLERIIQPSSLVFTYLVTTIAGAVFFGIWAAVLSFVGGFLIFNYFFLEPYYTFFIANPQDIYNGIVYFVIAGLLTYLIRIVRRQNSYLKDRLDKISLVENVTRDYLMLAPIRQRAVEKGSDASLQVRALNQLGKHTLKYIGLILHAPAFVLFRTAGTDKHTLIKSSSGLELTERDMNTAEKTMDNGELSGSGVPNSEESSYFFYPISSPAEAIGVLGVRYDYSHLTPEQSRILETIVNLTSICAGRWTAPVC
jgi:two-component system sensor histidine kinase KdpD